MTNNDENTSRQAESLWRSDDWGDLRWARKHSTPQQIARHLLDPQWRNRDYNALDELVEMTHDADLSSLDEDDLEILAASGLPELRQAIIRYAGTPARLLEDMARTESNTRLLQMLVESGKLSQNTIDLCCWNQTDSRLAASMLTKASDDLLHRLSGRDWWPSRKNAVESGRLDRKDLDDMIETENHPDVVSALIGTGEFDMDSEVNAIRRVITSPGLLTAYTNPMNRRYSLDQSRQEVVRQAARTMLEHAPVGMILSMPDDDDENWRTLIDTAATEYVDEISPNMLALIVQSEGNDQAKAILGERLGKDKDMSSGADEDQTPTASPGTDGTYGFNLRLLGRLKDDVDYFLGPSHAEKYLWAGSVDAQIAKLREIDGTIRPEDRPEWFTTEWIDQTEREMKTPADGGIEDALNAALSGQYAAFENAIIGYIDTHDPDAGANENGASQFAGYKVTDRVGNGAPMSYRLDWFDDEGLVHEGPKVTVKELVQMREGIFDSPDSWDSFGTASSTPAAAVVTEKKPEPVESRGPQIVFASLPPGHGMPEGAVNLLDDDAAQQVSDILSDAEKTMVAQTSPSDDERERRRGNISRLLDVLPVTMVTNDGSHQVDADEIMAATDRTERHDATAVGTEEPEISDTATHPDAVAEPFDWNGVDGLNAGIRDWYVHEFPDDPEGGSIDPQTTFREAVESFPMGDGHDFYAATGATDSIVRGRVFEELSSRLDCEYSDIYDAWLHRKSLNPTLLGTKSARMRHDIEDMLGGDGESFATVNAIAGRMASNPRLRAVIREADRFIAIGSHDFETGLKDAIGDQSRIEHLMDDDRLADLIYDMVHDGRRFDTSGRAVTGTTETLWAPDEFQSMLELITRVSDRLADNPNVRTIMKETTSEEDAAEAGLGQLIDDEIDVVSHENPDMARMAEDGYVTDGRFAQTVYRRIANIQTKGDDTETVETDKMGETPATATDSDAPDITGYDMEETVERLNRIRIGEDDPVAKARAVNAVSDIVAADSATNALITNPGNNKKTVLDEGRLRAAVATALTSMAGRESDGLTEAISGPDAVDQIAGQVYDLIAGNRRYDIDGLAAYLESNDDSATAETLEDSPKDTTAGSGSTYGAHAKTETEETSGDIEPNVDFGSPERELAAESSCRRAALARRFANTSPTRNSTG